MLRTRLLAASGALILAVAVAGCSAPDADSAADSSPSASASTVREVTPSPSDTTVEPVPSEFPPALQLVNYFQTQGLVVEDPRDNTAKGWCDADVWDCSEFLTSEQVSIVILPSADGAERLMATGSAYVSSDGRVGLSFAAQRTPVEQQDQFTRALEDYLLTAPAQD
ncbi:hypothetical protein AKG07_09830 [Microbacterium sp. CGR1]|uniref:hypothetical protein n=1 Tax=Microbacterium sp. CGR1 TaxID=1696072 RepID=UPI00069ED778|nr:hypothetical protein [Microbacterium sp. CGR1]AKV86548.1 hypothetical protein AKG07_09830 [Microbacterium sp. CGR1]